MMQTSLFATPVLRARDGTWDANASAEDLLSAMMDRYERSVFGYLLAIVRDRDVAHDCAQDTFLRAYDALRSGRAITAPWLYTVARNLAVDEFRRRRRLLPAGDVIEKMSAQSRPIDSALEVQAVLDALSPPDREALYLFEIAGFKTDEIGEMWGVRGSAVRQRLTRARQRFRAIYSSLSEEAPGGGPGT